MRRETIQKYILDSNYRFLVNSYLGLHNNMSDEEYVKKMFRIHLGYDINLDAPRTFCEKIQWLKLYDHNPIYTDMVDKLKAKKYAAERIGDSFIVPTIAEWKSTKDIDFDALPDQFVLKCNHNSGLGMYICKDKRKMDRKQVIKEIERGLKEDHYLQEREWPYKNVERKVFAEKYMKDDRTQNLGLKVETDGLIDYKFYCFNGEPKFLYVGFANMTNGVKNDLLTFLTLDWNIAPFYRKDHEPIPSLPDKPSSFSEMISIARILSEGIPFVRIDLFEINNKVYFSEFTFSPGAGYGAFYPEKWEEELGSWIILPCSKTI